MLTKLGKCALAGLLSVCTVLTAAPAMASAVRAADEAVVIDDTEFAYSAGKNANDGGWDSAAGADAAASEHWSNTVGAWAEIEFEGTKLEIYGKKAPNHRMFSVQIDGGAVVECDAYAAVSTDNNALLYSTEDAGIELEAGSHTARVTILDKANESASNVLGMNFAYVKVYGGELPEEPEFP